MNEKLQILKMLEEGKINAKEASELLEAIEPTKLEKDAISISDEYKKKYLKIRVYDNKENKSSVSVNLPISLVKTGVKLAMKFNPELSHTGLSENNFKDILSAINSEIEGEIINITTDNGKQNVKVYIE